MANKLAESIDRFGVPLTEGVEIEVPFSHNGRDAVALFDVSGGRSDRSPGREFPPEDVDPEVELVSLHFKDDDVQIDPGQIPDLTQLENSAVEKYLDHFDEYTGE